MRGARGKAGRVHHGFAAPQVVEGEEDDDMDAEGGKATTTAAAAAAAAATVTLWQQEKVVLAAGLNQIYRAWKLRAPVGWNAEQSDRLPMRYNLWKGHNSSAGQQEQHARGLKALSAALSGSKGGHGEGFYRSRQPDSGVICRRGRP